MTSVVLNALGQNGGPMDIRSQSQRMGVNDGVQGSDVSKALSGGSTVLGMIAKIASGNAKASQYRSAAVENRLSGQQALVEGTSATTGLRQQFLNMTGQRDQAAAMGGVDLGQGIAQDTRTAMGKDAAAASSLTRSTAEIKMRQLEIEALKKEKLARQAKGEGILGAGSLLLDTATKFAAIG